MDGSKFLEDYVVPLFCYEEGDKYLSISTTALSLHDTNQTLDKCDRTIKVHVENEQQPRELAAKQMLLSDMYPVNSVSNIRLPSLDYTGNFLTS